MSMAAMIRSDPQGVYSHNIPDDQSSFNRDDTVIVICSSDQLRYIKKYGNNFIMMDFTNGVVSGSKLKLTALVVVNEYGLGNIAASFITLHTDSETWKACLRTLEVALGCSPLPSVFMTDDDPSYYNAWVEVMGPPQRRLICTWHVGQSWKRQI